ncbi:PRC-barrel domain-containing protein [Pseudomonas sp. H11T01]|uniref:PRC-barrel domain-containing protein n=1 Tax=Pseudomonas sp. H11T01 TaxID=3402749 RepID=UPI003AC871B4
MSSEEVVLEAVRISAHKPLTSVSPCPDFERITRIINSRVSSLDGQDIGKLSDVLIDLRTGKIAYAVLAEGGFFGRSNVLHAVPWSALKFDGDAKLFHIAATAARVREDTGFQQDAWPNIEDRQWAHSLHRFYNTAPYWEPDAGHS